MLDESVWDELQKLALDEAPRMELAQKLMDEDPKLPFFSALTIAGDKISKIKADKLVEAGYSIMQASPFVGSYSRLDWLMDKVEQGALAQETLYPDLPDLWSGSDPDDTDIRFLNLWREAFRANGNKYLTDEGKTLPTTKMVTIYRGQDEDSSLGIAWSLSEDVARKFAFGAGTRQMNREGMILYKARISPKHVFAYLTGRKEEEVVVDPYWLR